MSKRTRVKVTKLFDALKMAVDSKPARDPHEATAVGEGACEHCLEPTTNRFCSPECAKCEYTEPDITPGCAGLCAASLTPTREADGKL